MSREHDDEKASGKGVETWELEMVQKVARAFRIFDRDELVAELSRKLVELKQRPPSDVQNWKAYLAKFLYNKASNWVRDTRNRERRVARAETDEDWIGTLPTGASLHSQEDLRIAFARLWRELDPELRRFWELLAQERGNQANVSRRLGIHRNTARLWIRKIPEILERHGF